MATLPSPTPAASFGFANEAKRAGVPRLGRAEIGRPVMAFAHLSGVVNRLSALLLPFIVLLGAVGLRVAKVPALEDLRLRAFDGFQRLRPRTYQPVPVRIVDLDNESLTRLGQWPWPRTQVAQLLRRIGELGAAVVAFDIVFAEPDRTSPAHVLPLWPSTPELELLRSTIGTLPDHDQVLAEVLKDVNVVTGFALTNEPNARQPALKASVAYAGDDPLQYAIGLKGAVTNLEALEASASGNGHFNLLGERDGIVRRVPLLLRLGDRLYPSLVAEAVRVAQGASTYLVKSSGASGETGFGQHTGMTHVKIGRLIVPTDGKGRMWVYYTEQVPERTIPAWRVLEQGFDPHALAGQLVFIGTSATGLKDLRATPLHPVAAGVEIHAQIAEQILTQEFLERPDWASGAEVVYLLVIGIGLIALLPRVGALWCALLGGIAILAVFAVSWYAFTTLHWLLDPVFPSLVVLLIYLVSSLLSFLRTETERRQVRHAFSRYLSPALVERLAQHPEHLVLGGEIRTMTLLFADIRGFTTIAEQFDAQGLTHFMNRFLTPMTGLILERRGTIDKYMGDCIMAFWNAPLDDAEHARHACQAALAMRSHLVVWNDELHAEAERLGRPFLQVHVGMGINTGQCCVGNVGSDQRFDYSVLGDEVNLASRLEGQSKTYGVEIVIGEPTRESVDDYATLELDLLMVKGKTRPVRIYGLLGDQQLKASERFQMLQAKHQEMLAAYRAQRWAEARTLIGECRTLEEDGRLKLKTLSDLYLARLEAYVAHPPGRDWDGVFVASSK